MKALMAQVKDNNATWDPVTNPFVPPKVPCEIECADPTFKYILTARRNGTKVLFYWLDKALWRVSNNTRIGTTSGTVTQQKLGQWPEGNLTGGQPMTEASAMMHSRIHPNVVWCTDDSNPQHYVWAFDYTGGISFKKTIELVGNGFTITEHAQWEDGAYDITDNSMWIADCGGNKNEFTAYKFDEPTSISGSGTVTQVPCDRYKFQYAGGESYNCEAMMCDTNGRVYFIPKHNGVGDGQNAADTGLWRAPATLAAWPTANTLTKVATIGDPSNTPAFLIGAADWAPDNSFFCVVKNATGVDVATKPTITTTKFRTASPWDSTGEFEMAVASYKTLAGRTQEIGCFLPDSSGFLNGSEGSGSELWLTDFGTGGASGSPMTLETTAGVVNLTATPIVQSYEWT
jgi:hypothetical protein